MTDEHLDRLRAMVESGRGTWDLGPRDVVAILALMEVEWLTAELAAERARSERLREEVERLCEEVAVACRMFSKCRWTGSLDMTNEFHVERGRRMAGLGAGAIDGAMGKATGGDAS
jgi:hypothetical protein